MKYIYIFFQGKSTFFAFMFFSVGSALAFLGKLTPEYVSMAAAVQALLVTRSVMDDVHQRAMDKQSSLNKLKEVGKEALEIGEKVHAAL